MAAPNAAVHAKPKPRQTPAARENTTGAMNTIVRWLLRSPLHGVLSPWLMLVTYTGRKSGKTYTTPVSYVKSAGAVIFFTAHKWWHNFEASSPVTLRFKGRDLHGVAEAVADPYKIEPVVRAFLEGEGGGQRVGNRPEIEGEDDPAARRACPGHRRRRHGHGARLPRRPSQTRSLAQTNTRNTGPHTRTTLTSHAWRPLKRALSERGKPALMTRCLLRYRA